jgi:hypothetical protein
MTPLPYYYFIKSRLERVLKNTEKKFSVSLGNTGVDSDIKIDIQFEHAIFEDKTTGTYRPLFHNYDKIKNNDIIIEYSATNFEICQMYKSELDFTDKVIYVPPLMYDSPNLNTNGNRDKNIIVFHASNERRGFITNQCDAESFGSYDDDVIAKTYQNYKILLNIHQTDNFVTIEEFRILPALMNGILIISESGPLIEKTPYYNHIVWADYDSIVNVTKNVLKNYDVLKTKHHHKLEENLNNLSNKIDLDLYNKIKEILS